ncbi:endonuclease/exonuclease/phosphatase family protein [Roseiconus nitratireducens]|uniref:Endonuclease/exonuclease/phosphatase family protein n=1 Tax=Roseiconus nitratireducens TaxID=2605748 RepID=A0A5M6DEF3_9BACT|nr:endonuclease/exonuclease/phosphatase family protein [Roseiconus nitratireducens]KAA5545908.1 endonuclease/exonuclease/phosphatase family protein [Roseiconus nitratireducens]
MAKPVGPVRRAIKYVLRLAVLTLVILTLFSLFARSLFLAELVASLRVQISIGAAALLLVALVDRDFWNAGVITTCMVIHASFLLPQMWRPSREIEMAEEADNVSTMTVMTLNALSANTHYDWIADQIVQDDPDAVGILELGPGLDAFLRKRFSERYPHKLTVPSDAGNFGIGLFSRRPLSDSQVIQWQRGVPTIQAEIDGVRMILAHPLPPVNAANFQSRNEQLQKLVHQVQGHRRRDEDAPIVVMGDLNLTPWSPWFYDLQSQTGLRRSFEGLGLRPTWYANRLGFLAGLVLDHVLVSDSISVDRVWIGSNIGSDHRGVSVRMHWPSASQ